MRVERNFSPLKIFISDPNEQLILQEIVASYIDKYTNFFNPPFLSDKKKESLMFAKQLYKELEKN